MADEEKKKRRGHGEGSIYERKQGGYASQLTVGRDRKTGKLQRVTYYGKTITEVRNKLNDAKYKLAQNKLVRPSSLTLGKWMDEWLEVYKKNSVKQSTYRAYASWVENHIKPVLGDI